MPAQQVMSAEARGSKRFLAASGPQALIRSRVQWAQLRE
jgi:hypothetical protein